MWLFFINQNYVVKYFIFRKIKLWYLWINPDLDEIYKSPDDITFRQI
jgi:hypothetical protein